QHESDGCNSAAGEALKSSGHGGSCVPCDFGSPIQRSNCSPLRTNCTMPGVRRYSQHAGNTCGSLTYGVRRYPACGRWRPVFTVFTDLLKCLHKKQKATRFSSDSAVGPILLEFSRRQSE